MGNLKNETLICSVLFLGKILPNFNLCKGKFSMGKMAQICQVSKFIFPNCQIASVGIAH
jgi:hypothetical protein